MAPEPGPASPAGGLVADQGAGAGQRLQQRCDPGGL